MASESGAGTYAELAGIEIVNNARVMAYLENGLGPSSLNIYGECGSCGCSNLRELIGCDDEYVSPIVDNAPWYTSDAPESADFLGFFADGFTGLDSPFEREVAETVNNGGILSRSRLKTRELTWRGFLFGATCCSVQYGLRWLSKTLSQFDASCRDCFGDDLEFLYCCPSVTGAIEPFRTLKGVGLIEGPLIQSERATCRSGCSNGCGGSCIIEVEFTLVATQPYLYSSPIPVYDCVNLYDGSTTPFTDDTIDCGPFDCSDIFFDSVYGFCPLPALPPTAEYTNSCAPVFTTPLANYYSVSSGLWKDLDEVVPVISITSGSLALGGLVLGFYSSKSGNPCGDLSLFPPDCDVICDELTIISMPAYSTFYIDGRTRKIAIICSDGSAFPGERLTTGPWSWPSFDCYGFCMEVRFEGDTDTDTQRSQQSCVSLSLVPRSF